MILFMNIYNRKVVGFFTYKDVFYLFIYLFLKRIVRAEPAVPVSLDETAGSRFLRDCPKNKTGLQSKEEGSCINVY